MLAGAPVPLAGSDQRHCRWWHVHLVRGSCVRRPDAGAAHPPIKASTSDGRRWRRPSSTMTSPAHRSEVRSASIVSCSPVLDGSDRPAAIVGALPASILASATGGVRPSMVPRLHAGRICCPFDVAVGDIRASSPVRMVAKGYFPTVARFGAQMTAGRHVPGHPALRPPRRSIPARPTCIPGATTCAAPAHAEADVRALAEVGIRARAFLRLAAGSCPTPQIDRPGAARDARQGLEEPVERRPDHARHGVARPVPRRRRSRRKSYRPRIRRMRAGSAFPITRARRERSQGGQPDRAAVQGEAHGQGRAADPHALRDARRSST